jgi:4,4'-diaponeurosporenoate glycosyltransferase
MILVPVIFMLFFWLVGFALLLRVPVCTKKTIAPHAIPRISVIIPARNEERNLPRLIQSFENQHVKPHEIIVVDDHSDDATARIAKERGARVIAAPALPPDWLGKPWACHQGAQAATGDVFIFLDADTFLEPEGFQKIINQFTEQPGALSIGPYHRMQRPYEAFSAFFNIMQAVGVYGVRFLANARPIGMFGQCVMISRDDYLKSEGHSAVKDQVLEHYAFGLHLRNNTIPFSVCSGRGTLNVQLYPGGVQTVIKGWGKSFAAGAQNTPKPIMRLSSMWMTGLIMTPIVLLAGCIDSSLSQQFMIATVYLLYAVQLCFHLRRLGNFHLWTALVYPVPLCFFLWVFMWSNYKYRRKETVEWKGRFIHKEQ